MLLPFIRREKPNVHVQSARSASLLVVLIPGLVLLVHQVIMGLSGSKSARGKLTLRLFPAAAGPAPEQCGLRVNHLVRALLPELEQLPAGLRACAWFW